MMIRATDEHATLLADFYRKVWDSDATPEAVLESRAQQAERNRVTPGAPSPTFLYLKDHEAVGHVGTIPLLLWFSGRTHPAHWIKGLMVLPEHQKGAAGFLLLRKAVSELPVSMVIVGSDVARGLLTTLKFLDLGAFPNYLKIVRPGQFLTKIDLSAVGGGRVPAWAVRTLRVLQATSLTRPLGGLAGLGMKVRDFVTGSSRVRFETVPSEALTDAALDELWMSARAGIDAGGVRDAHALRAAYSEPHYRLIGVRVDARLAAVVVLRAPRDSGDPRLNGIRIATVSDLVCDPGDSEAVAAALLAAERAARADGADAVLCSATHHALRDALARAGYRAVPSNLHILARSVNDDIQFDTDASRWWLLRGDSKADDVF